jgi:RNA polymerase subunit RPABC4/transcription elongation factor Spt4
MPDTFITSNEVFTLNTSFQNFIKKMKKICPGCKTADLAREYAMIDTDKNVIAINVIIKELENRVGAAVSRDQPSPR